MRGCHERAGILGILAMMLLALASPHKALAVDVESLLMPGKLSKAHIKQETNCGNCHDRTNRVTQTSLCVDCHKDIAEDLRTHSHYHGRMRNAGAGECKACHTEHKGREADITQMSTVQFDHALTEFSLEGAHAGLECGSCHKRAEPWRKAELTCLACHKRDDVHRGQFTKTCGDCHSSISWTGGKFDHDATEFRLTGAHVMVDCDACHVGGRYKPTPKSCNGCHATDDEHRGSRGADCGKCHTTKEWKTAQYDHLKETGYALLGVHAEVDCLACHRDGDYKTKIPKDCDGCHRADDSHARRFGAKCGDCHDNERWRPVEYDHLKRHKFTLEGAHAKLACSTCHTAVASEQKLPTDCEGCHRSEDPHAGTLNHNCATCHGQQDWRRDIAFDHDLTDFPLLGLHRVVSCVQCHAGTAFKEAPTRCSSCHAADDVHDKGLGDKCETCHSSNGWSLWVFDHAKDAHFPLLGAHAKLQCAECHSEPPGSHKMSQECVSCHRKDDRHLGQYGGQCDRCHSNYSWKGARVQ